MNSEYGELVNLDSLHYAKVLNDTVQTATRRIRISILPPPPR
jgi:hypothetical protein